MKKIIYQIVILFTLIINSYSYAEYVSGENHFFCSFQEAYDSCISKAMDGQEGKCEQWQYSSHYHPCYYRATVRLQDLGIEYYFYPKQICLDGNCDNDPAGCCETNKCGTGANAQPGDGGEICIGSECASRKDKDGPQSYSAVAKEGWDFQGWEIPDAYPDDCEYQPDGKSISIYCEQQTCPDAAALFMKKDNEEICDLYPAHDDYAVKVTGSKKDGSCYEGISVVSSQGDRFHYSFTETHHPDQNTAAPLDSPWMSSDEWKEFCVNTVMGDPTCFEDSGEEEFTELEPPIGDIEPPPDIGEEELDPSPDDQELEDQGEWAINDNIKKMDSNQQKRYEGLTGYLQQLAQKIASAIDSSKSQNHRDLQTLDKNQRARNDQLISAIKGSKSEFKDLDDTDEEKIGGYIDNALELYKQYWNDEGSGVYQNLERFFDEWKQVIENVSNAYKEYWNEEGTGVYQSLDNFIAGWKQTLDDYIAGDATISEDEIQEIEAQKDLEQTEYENKLQEFIDNVPVNDISEKFNVDLRNPDCSFSINMLGHQIVFSFCEYGSILTMMGSWLIFLAYVTSLYMVLKA
jgi:hypothetical protein